MHSRLDSSHEQHVPAEHVKLLLQFFRSLTRLRHAMHGSRVWIVHLAGMDHPELKVNKRMTSPKLR